MQNDSEDIEIKIVDELQRLLQQSRQIQHKLMGQILTLEKVVNCSRKTIPERYKKQEIDKVEPSQDLNQEQVDRKVNTMLLELEMKQKMLEENPRQKLEIKPPPQPVIEKKPPIPTANRAEKTVKNTFPTYVPPRNKNQVTGKVTQTTIRTNQQKVFKPEQTAMKRSSSRQFAATKTTMRSRQSAERIPEKIQSKKEVPTHTQPQKISTPVPTKSAVNEVRQTPAQRQPKKEDPNIQLATFNKQLEQTLDEIFAKSKKSNKHKIQKLIKDCQNEEMGHKKNEEASRMNFIKHANNYALSRNNVNPVFSLKINRKKWKYYPELFQFVCMLDGIQKQLSGFQNLKQYRPDPRQEYRIIQSTNKMSDIINAIEQDVKDVPGYLSLNFTNEKIKSQTVHQEDQLQKISPLQLHQHFSQLLQKIGESQQLRLKQLKALRVLIEVGFFKSRKSPSIVHKQQYEAWLQHNFAHE